MTQLPVINNVGSMPEITKFAAQKSYMRLDQVNPDSAYLSISVAKEGSDGALWFLDTVSEELASAVPALPVTALPLFLIEKISYEKQTIGSKLFNGYHVIERRERAYAVINLNEQVGFEFLGWFSYDATTRAPIGNKEGIAPQGVSDEDCLKLVSGVVQRINKNLPAWDQRKTEWDGKDTTYGLLKKQQAGDRVERKARKANK